MSDFLRLMVVFFAAINPAAVAMSMVHAGGDGERRANWRVAAIGGVTAVVMYALACWVAPHLLDWLQIAPESFRVAAGIVMATMGVEAIWFGAITTDGDDVGIQAAVFPLGVPLIAGPAGLMAAVSYGDDQGFGRAFGAAAVIVAVVVALLFARPERGRPALGGMARVTGALLVAVAAGLIVSGVREI